MNIVPKTERRRRRPVRNRYGAVVDGSEWSSGLSVLGADAVAALLLGGVGPVLLGPRVLNRLAPTPHDVGAGSGRAGAYVVWRRSQPGEDPWAEAYWADSTEDEAGYGISPEDAQA